MIPPGFKSTDTSNIHLIERRYVQGPPGTVISVEPNRPVSLIIVSVKQGGVEIFFGSYGGDDGRICPDLHFGQTNGPVYVPIPPTQMGFRIVAVGAANPVYASVMLCGD